MPENNEPVSPGTPGTNETPAQRNQIDPELVRQIADKVLAMLVEDLRIEQERMRYGVKQGRRSLGGR